MSLCKLLQDSENLIKFKTLFEQYYVMFSLVTFMDAVVGNSADDFNNQTSWHRVFQVV